MILQMLEGHFPQFGSSLSKNLLDFNENLEKDVSVDNEVVTKFWKLLRSALAEVCALQIILFHF